MFKTPTVLLTILPFLTYTLLMPKIVASYSVVHVKRYNDHPAVHRIHDAVPIMPDYSVLDVDDFGQRQPIPYPVAVAPPVYSSPDYTYSQDYFDQPDYYNAPESDTYGSYPYYDIAPPRAAVGNVKYVYQSPSAPYYYRKEHQKPTYGYFSYTKPKDPVEYLEKEIHQEERAERGQLPIGREVWFDGSVSPGVPDAEERNTLARNLLFDEMYNDLLSGENTYYNPADLRKQNQQYPSYDYYNDDDTTYVYPEYKDQNQYYVGQPGSDTSLEDEEVKELKSLVKHNNKKSVLDSSYEEISEFPNEWGTNVMPKINGQWSDTVYETDRFYKKKQESSAFGPWIPPQGMPITFTDRKGTSGITFNKFPTKAPVTLSTNVPTTTVQSEETTTMTSEFDPKKGQKEVPMLRPGNTGRRYQNLDRLSTRSKPDKHSVYDAIKQLLSMEKELRMETEEQQHSKPQKRFVSNEESLVQELSGLKKLAI